MNLGGKKIYNLGCGKGYSVLDIIHTFEKITNHQVSYKIIPRRIGDIAESIADTELARQELSWQTKKSLEEMIKDTWRWQQNSEN
jgi:UDP-glucose 4-epimerase